MRYFSIRTKILLVVLLSFLLALLTVFALFGTHYRQQLLDSINRQFEYECEISARSVQSCSETATSCLNTVILQLNDALSGEDMDGGYPSLKTTTQKKIYQCLLNSFTMFRDPQELLIVWNNGTAFYQGNMGNVHATMYTMYTGETDLTLELEKLQVSRRGTWLTGLENFRYAQGDGLYFAKALQDISTNRMVGYVILKLNPQSLGLLDDDRGRRFYLFEPGGLLVYTNDAQVLDGMAGKSGYDERLTESLALLESLDAGGKNGLQTDRRTTGSGWTLVTVASMHESLQALNQSILLLTLALVAIFLLLYGIVCAVISRMLRPIRTLSDYLQRFDAGLPAPLEMRRRNDESGILIDRYNRMAGHIQKQVEEISESRTRQKKMEFALLQSQIKPHFLYNTLDVIYCLGEMGRCAESSAMAKLLSDYYRLTLAKGMDEVPLSREIDMVRIYMEIQSVRYKSVLQYEIRCPEDVPQVTLPKLTLQPLVENAIYHGIKPACRPGRVTVEVKESEQALEIRVADDGVGCSREDFAAAVSDRKGDDESYGLYNVAMRLRLLFGERCAFGLEDVPQGTSVLIRITEQGGEGRVPGGDR